MSQNLLEVAVLTPATSNAVRDISGFVGNVNTAGAHVKNVGVGRTAAAGAISAAAAADSTHDMIKDVKGEPKPRASAAKGQVPAAKGQALKASTNEQMMRESEMRTAIREQLVQGVQTEQASSEILNPHIIDILGNYLQSYHTNMMASCGLYTAWLITILCILTKDELFGIVYR